MRFEKRLSQALLAVVLGATASAGALAQSVTTRLVTAGGSATTATIAPGGTVSIDVRMDVVTAQLIGTGFTLSQTTPASNGFFSITGRSFTGSPFNDTTSGTPDATVLAAPSNLLDPTNNDNLGRQTVGLAGTPPVANMLAANLTLTASASTPLGTYTVAPTAGVSFASDDAFNDYDMSTAAPFTIVVGQTLTVNKTGAGSGTVTADSGPINCGATCSGVYPGTVVTLTATPAGGSTFAGWSGSGCTGTGTCVVTVDAAKSVTAQFDIFVAPTFALNVTKAGTGTGTVTSAPAGINCGADCSENFAENTVVTLTAAPAASSTFAGWSGAGCSGTGTCVVTMSAAASVQATFNAAVTLTVAKAGNGTGTVTSDVGGINCGSTCAVGYPNGTVVTLTAAPGTGQNFTGWSGGGCSGTGTCVVTLTAATTVTATFTDTTPPDTTILSGPSNPSNDPNPTFTFESSEPGSTFQCSLNGAAFTACTSPRTVTVNNGEQSFSVQAVDAAGNVDPTPATYAWTAAGIIQVVVQPIPTLSEWALILLSLMMASLGLVAYRRRM
jgi:hypothetical protein